MGIGMLTELIFVRIELNGTVMEVQQVLFYSSFPAD